MVAAAGEEQFVGVGCAVGCPVRAVVHLAVVARLKAIRSGTATVAGVTDDALVHGGDPLLTAEVQRSVAVVLEHREVVDGVAGGGIGMLGLITACAA